MVKKNKVSDDKLIILTGGAGFIGSCMMRYLNDAGFHNIVVVDQLGTDERWKNLVGKEFAEVVPIYELFDWLEGRAEEIQAILHLGACTNTVETDADYLLDNNYRFSIELAEYALRHDIRFVYASSAATYGDGSLGFSDDHDLIASLRPLNMYGFSKHLFDLWVLRQGVADRLTGLKFFNVFGPNEYHKGRMASPILRMMEQVQKEGAIKLFKSDDPDRFPDGGQVRDFIYVKDVVRLIHTILQNELVGIYNIGRGVATPWNELALAVFKALGATPSLHYIPMPDDLVGKYQNYTCAEMKKLATQLSAHGKVKFSTTAIEAAVEDLVSHYLVSRSYW
jgi:ADP-L-glycero-D-manno-heptose 6-epimerase